MTLQELEQIELEYKETHKLTPQNIGRLAAVITLLQELLPNPIAAQTLTVLPEVTFEELSEDMPYIGRYIPGRHPVIQLKFRVQSLCTLLNTLVHEVEHHCQHTGRREFSFFELNKHVKVELGAQLAEWQLLSGKTKVSTAAKSAIQTSMKLVAEDVFKDLSPKHLTKYIEELYE